MGFKIKLGIAFGIFGLLFATGVPALVDSVLELEHGTFLYSFFSMFLAPLIFMGYVFSGIFLILGITTPITLLFIMVYVLGFVSYFVLGVVVAYIYEKVRGCR